MNIKTERLLLKPFSEADKETMIEIFKDETVARTFMTPIFHSEEEVEKLFEYMRLASLSEKRLVVGLYLNDQLIGFTEIITGAFEENTASIRVMEKCGMTLLEKTEEIEYRGKSHHCVYYSIKNN